MLRRENELRLCEETQAMFRSVGDRYDGWLEVVEALQKRVAREFGLAEAVGLAAMRGAEGLLPTDPEVVEISLYPKYNRCVDGALHAGSPAPNPLVHTLTPPSSPNKINKINNINNIKDNNTPNPRPLLSLLRGPRPLVLFAGSHS